MPDKSLLNQVVPNFSFQATNQLTAEISDYRGQFVVLYFYPKDNTPGCTHEAKDFRDHYTQFKKAKIEIFGISRDSLATHTKFQQKHQLPFELIADPDEEICRLFNVIRPKVLFGKTLLGILRSTFLINPQGVVCKEWRKVSVKGHAEAVWQACQEQLQIVTAQPLGWNPQE